MTNNNDCLKLYIPEKNAANFSDFRIGLMEDELKCINAKYPIEDGNLDMKISYVSEIDEGLEIGIYIRNNTSRTINFDIIPLELTNGKDVVAYKVFDLSGVGNIPRNSVVFNTIQFEKKDINSDKFDPNAELSIGFAGEVNYKAETTLKVDIDNVPKDFKYQHRKHLENFINSLPRLISNSVSIHAYAVDYDEDQNLDIVVLIRNGYDREIEILTIPISIYDTNDILIYAGLYKVKEMKIREKTAKIFMIKIDENYLPIKDADLSTFRVEFKQ
jgi:hypothetical protein